MGELEIGTIPNHIDRRPEGAGPGLHDWIRIGVYDGAEGGKMPTVVLNRAQVERVRDSLSEWLNRSAIPESEWVLS